MSEFAFPAQLLAKLHTYWEVNPSSARSVLPDDTTSLRLLEICYHASLRTAELRVTRCVLAYTPAEALAHKSLLRFEYPATLTPSELVRLAPVTEQHRTLIGCYYIDGELKIWGLFEHGHAWLGEALDSLSGAPATNDALPQVCLTISIEGPGTLSVAHGVKEVVRLREGKIIPPHKHPLRQLDEPLGRFFETLLDSSLNTASDDRSKSDSSIGPREAMLDTYIMVIARILERIRSERHGGSLVISASPLNELQAYHTYAVAEHVALLDDILSYCDALKCLQEASKSLGSHADEVAKYKAETFVRLTGQSLNRGISRVSLLAAIDGAVLLDGKLCVEGFGVRFPVLLPPGATILDAITGIAYPCEQWGLRHQSIYSVCQQCEEAVGFVVSQDGSVKGVKYVNGMLHFWDGILD
ncbi:putative sensor domain DACNV-containing protein [Pirellulaceae bacterium SH449]